MLAALTKIAILILTFWYSLLVHGLGGIHEQPVNRCLGQFDLDTAEPTGSSDAVLDRLTRLPPGRNSCRLACVLHQDCWAAHHDKDEFGVETCTLYSYSGVQQKPGFHEDVRQLKIPWLLVYTMARKQNYERRTRHPGHAFVIILATETYGRLFCTREWCWHTRRPVDRAFAVGSLPFN
ncbi:hypothetical protein FBUS_07185 [Fasciolopsis buskii]|uniref:Apple domain-containing protein n=1 Tax=Fasciolopsis buskii TaxID=27845 RepID=A0A8E0RK68_9TREM|nr:hypothetical protein FBUS_07185 [Fasciolopsis buski]